MTCQWRAGIVTPKPQVRLSGEVEGDEGYGVAGHKGHPEAGQKKAGQDDASD
jgi:transposase